MKTLTEFPIVSSKKASTYPISYRKAPHLMCATVLSLITATGTFGADDVPTLNETASMEKGTAIIPSALDVLPVKIDTEAMIMTEEASGEPTAIDAIVPPGMV